jgi:2,4-dienoyl-CoA reductase-like NADH-dependent reductase (Old Yellow Enzyme family)
MPRVAGGAKIGLPRPIRAAAMPDLFSPLCVKDVTLRNRIAMSPMTQHRAVDGRVGDFHVMMVGSRAAGGFGLVFPEQVAITADGRTSVHCAGLWDDAQIEGFARMTRLAKEMGAVPAIQLGHTGRKGSECAPWLGRRQLPPDHPEGWQVRGPSAVPYGGVRPYPVQPLSTLEIADLHRAYADAARRALDAGFEWLELHFAHGYLGASFFSPIANRRTDAYGGSLENRVRFHLEAIDAVRTVWPERLPLTMRLGSDDLNPAGVTLDESIVAIRMMKDHGLDLADLSIGFNTDEMSPRPFAELAFMVERASRVRREVGIPVATSWNLGHPQVADRVIRDGAIDLVMLGKPALSNPHWPLWAARELAHPDPFALLPEDWAWWMRNSRGHPACTGWPEPGAAGPVATA